MASWFKFNTTNTDSNITPENNLVLIENLTTLVNRMGKNLESLNRENNLLRQKIKKIFENYTEDEELRYQCIIDVLNEYMTKQQFQSYTTKIDIDYFESIFNYKPTNKKHYIYCYLMTIARKAIEEQNKNLSFLFEDRHKLTMDTRNTLNNSEYMRKKVYKGWLAFLQDYQFNNLEI